MGDASYAQTSFLGGEVSKYAQGRFDLPTYRISLNVCLNSFPVEQGAWTRRPGTQFANTTRGGQQSVLIAFDIKQSAPYLIEFTSGFLRFWNGATLVTTNDDVGVSSISTANPAAVTTAAVHGWSTGNAVKFANLGTTCPLLQNRVFTITKTGNSAFTLVDAITGATIDGSTLGVGSLAAAATVQRILEVATPYTSASVQGKTPRLVQTEQAALILHPTIPPQVLRATPPAVGQTFYSFALVAANFLDGPFLDAPTNGAQLLPSGTTGNITLTLQFAAYVASTSYSVGSLVLYSSVNYISLTDQNVGNQPDTHPANWAATSAGTAIGPNGFLGTDIGRYIRLLDSASNWTWGKITAVSNLISASLAGSVNIGNMTQSGGLAAAFDSVLSQTASAGAAISAATTDPLSGYVGKNYSGASTQKIGYAVIWPSSDLGLYVANYTFTQTVTTYAGRSNNCTLQWTFPSPQTFVNGDTITGAASGATGVITNVVTGHFGIPNGVLTLTGVTRAFQTGEGINSAHANGQVATFVDNGPDYWLQTGQTSPQSTLQTGVNSLVINLRAKQTAPASSSDGTLLGAAVGGGTQPITIVSNDQTTAWNYVWLEIVASGIQDALPSNLDQRTIIPITLGGTASAFVYTLNSFSIAEYVAEAQFYNPAGTGSGNAVSFQILGNALADNTARSVWRLGTYSSTTGFPACGTYHEARLWLAGAIGNRLDASVSGQALAVVNQVASSSVNFAPTQVGGQVLDSSAISATFSAPDVNTIFWLVPDALGIICGTQAGDWLVQATANNVPLTPTTIQAHRFSKMGCANIEPRRADHTLIIVQRFRRKLFEYFADVFSGKFGAQNVTLNSRHLTKPGIAEIAYQQELVPVIWARCDDGSLFGVTYKRESNVSAQPPNFAGAHSHALGSGRLVESIAVGPSADGTLDSLAMVTNDATTNIRHVEIMTKLFEEGSAESAAWFLDDAISPSSTTSTTAASAGQPYGALTINGLWHANARFVTVFAGGLDCGDYLVSNGSITVPYGDGVSAGTGGGLFTPVVAVAGPIVAGFTFTSQGQIVRPATPQESGARNGPALGKKRRTMQMAALLDNTVGISFGTSFDKLFPALFRQPNDVAYATGQPFSGVYWTTLTDSHSYDSMICWQITRPYSATVCAIEGFISTQDK